MTNSERPQYIFGCRWANRRDHEEIADIMRRYGNRGFESDQVHKLIRAKYRELIVASLEGENLQVPLVVGFLMYYRMKEWLFVENLMVHPEWTGCGAGSALLGWFWHEKLPVHAVTRRPDVASFYAKQGWDFAGESENGFKFVRKPS